MTNIKERVLYLSDFYKIKKEFFFKELGLSYANFKGIQKKSALNSDAIDIILSKYKNISARWLLTGKGEILRSDKPQEQLPSAYKSHEGYPLVSISAIAGFGSAEFAIGDRDVKDLYVIPKFKDRKIDFMIEITGSSMYPKYNSGDVIACRKIKESNFIQWNKVHVLATTEQGILVKRLKKADDDNYLLAVSDNKDYDPFLIPKKEITGIALVIGVIRLE